MRVWTRSLVPILAGALLISTVGCGSAPAPQAKAKIPITIGMAVGLTGYLAGFDGPVLSGAQLAVKEINAHGGVLGRPLKLIYIDMASNPQQGVQAVDQLITSDHVVALANGFSSAGTAAEEPIAAQNQVPMVVASVVPPTDTWVFSTLPMASFETGVRVDYLKAQHITTVGIIMDNTPYAALLYAAAKPQLQAAGIRIVDVESQSTTATDLRPQLSHMLSFNPGAVMKFGSGPTAVVVAKDLSQLGATVPLLLSIDSLTVFQQASQAYSHVFFAAAPPQVVNSLPASRRSTSLVDFTKLWTKTNPTEDPTNGGRGWDAIYLIAKAITKANSTKGSLIRAAFETMGPYQGTTGTYTYTSSNHYGLSANPMVLAKWGTNGPQVVLYPPGS